MYQKFIGVIAGEKAAWRCIGLLTISFERKPKKARLDEVEKIDASNWRPGLESPKSDPVKSEFVSYLEEVFILGGPLLKGL